MKRHTIQSLASAAVNFSVVAVIVGITLALRKGVLVSPVRSGFFCGDMSIRHPIKNESVATNMLIVGGSFGVLVLIAISEYFTLAKHRRDIPASKTVLGKSVSIWIITTLAGFLLYLFGLCITSLIIDLGKNFSGVLRPNFFEMCQPNISCDDEDPNEYQNVYQCLNTNEKQVVDSSKSFPSGHAAVVAFISFYISFYLQRRPEAFKHVFILRPSLQIGAISVAWVTSLTRISDHVHHASDVIVGFAIGILIALWAVMTADDLIDQQKSVKIFQPEQVQMSMKPRTDNSVDVPSENSGDMNDVTHGNHIHSLTNS